MSQEFTLLVVDDEKQNRMLLTELLQDDYRVILAKTGRQAVELARQHLPDLILLDVLMPDLDGFATIRMLKQEDRTRAIPVIFISALDSPGDEEVGLDLGAVDYITKPFHPPIVRARVRNHLQAVHQRRLLEQLAMLDGLTGIPNRRRFDEVYAQEWRRCLRASLPLSLLVADVDFFKIYNDTLGHAAGDRVLREVAAALRQVPRRPGDLVARYGGEEFVVLLPETSAADAQALAGQLLREVSACAIPHPDSSASPWVSLSIGGTTVLPGMPDIDPGVFARADAQLYQAKQQGRNRICWQA